MRKITIHVTLDGTTWHELTFAVGCYEHKDTSRKIAKAVRGYWMKKD